MMTRQVHHASAATVRRLVRTAPVLAAALLILASSMAAAPAAPTPEDLPALAESLAARLRGTKVALPDGSEAWTLQPTEGSADAPRLDALLTRERLQTCLDTVSEAEAWPAAWLVVQERDREFDLVMRIALDDDGQIATPDFLFTVSRREWEVGDVKQVVPRATGRKAPRKGIGNLVIQGFSKKIVTTYVYEKAPAGEGAGGLAALLPAGAMIREAKAADVGDGRRYTLALVLQDAIFQPSDCTDCAAALFGHADSGKILLLLAGEQEIVDQIDLTEVLAGDSGRPLLPRYRCEPGDAETPPAIEAFAERELVSLLRLADLDGDGRPLEFELPVEPIGCDRHLALRGGIEPSGPSLALSGAEVRETDF